MRMFAYRAIFLLSTNKNQELILERKQKLKKVLVYANKCGYLFNYCWDRKLNHIMYPCIGALIARAMDISMQN